MYEPAAILQTAVLSSLLVPRARRLHCGRHLRGHRPHRGREGDMGTAKQRLQLELDVLDEVVAPAPAPRHIAGEHHAVAVEADISAEARAAPTAGGSGRPRGWPRRCVWRTSRVVADWRRTPALDVRPDRAWRHITRASSSSPTVSASMMTTASRGRLAPRAGTSTAQCRPCRRSSGA